MRAAPTIGIIAARRDYRERSYPSKTATVWTADFNDSLRSG